MELPSLPQRAELVRRYAHLLQHFGSEIGRRPLVLQDGKFFPDRFDKDQPSLERLVQRLQQHGGLADIPVGVRLVDAEGAPVAAGSCGTSSGGCGSGACGPSPKIDGAAGFARLVEEPSGWVIQVREPEVHHAVMLTCTLSRALAHIFLAETTHDGAPIEEPHEASTDLAAVALGFGLLLMEGSYVYAKSCGGPSVAQFTALSVGELSIACSLFIAMGQHPRSRALAGLGTTQRALLGEACDWAASNGAIVQKLATAPALLAEKPPEVKDTRSWLLRLFDRPAKQRDVPSLDEALAGGLDEAEMLRLARAAAPASAASRSAPAKSQADDELRALVDEALRSP